MKIFSGSSNKPLAEKIAKFLGKRLGELEIHVFADGEKRIRVGEEVVDEHCVLIESASPDVDKNYMELFFIADALKRNGAKSITAIIPYLGYQRQDHMFRMGETVSLEVIIKILEGAGIGKVITLDLHSVRIPELFQIPVVHLSALPIFAEKIRGLTAGPAARSSKGTPSSLVPLRGTANEDALLWTPPLASPAFSSIGFEDVVLVSPDMGGIRRIKILSKMLEDMPYATVLKNRDVKTGRISVSKIEGEIKKNAIIVDDMISTGRTIVLASELLRKKGVEKIFVFATHPVFSGEASKVLQESFVEKVFVTDTIDIPREKQFEKLEVLSVAGMISKSIQRSKFKGQNSKLQVKS